MISNIKTISLLNYFVVLFGINDSNTCSIENLIPLKLGVRDIAFFIISHERRLNKTESATYISLFWFGCSRGIDFYQTRYMQHDYFWYYIPSVIDPFILIYINIFSSCYWFCTISRLISNTCLEACKRYYCVTN